MGIRRVRKAALRTLVGATMASTIAWAGSLPALAALTFDANSISSNGALTINGAATSAVNIGTAATTGAITIGAATAQNVSITDDSWSITTAGVATFADVRSASNAAIAITPQGTGDLTVLLDADSEAIFLATAAPAEDLVVMRNNGNGATTNGVDGLYINFETGDGANVTNNGLRVDMVTGGTAAGDTTNAVYLSVDAADASTQHGLKFATGFDLDITADTNTDLNIGALGTGDTVFSVDSDSPIVISGGTDAQADITTATNERLYIEPNGTGDTHFHQDNDTQFMWGITGDGTGGPTIARMMYDTATTLAAGGGVTGLDINLNTDLSPDAGGNAITGIALNIDAGGAGETIGISLMGAPDVGIRFTGATTDLQSAATEALTIESGSTGTINIGTDASAETINLGTGAAVKTLVIGSTTAGANGDVTIQTGDDLLLNPADDARVTLAADGQFILDAATTVNTGTDGVLKVIQTSITTNSKGINLEATANDGVTTDAEVTGMFLRLSNADADGEVVGLDISAVNAAGNAADMYTAGIRIDSAETTASNMTDAILITSSGVNNGVVDAIDASAANITNALNIGANAIVGTTGAITFTGATTWSSTGGDVTVHANVDAMDLLLAGGDTLQGTLTDNNDVEVRAEDDFWVNVTDETNFRLQATGALVIDGATNDSTETAGVVNMDVDAGNAAVNGIDLNLEQADGAGAGTEATALFITLAESDADGDMVGINITAAATAVATVDGYEAAIKIDNAENTAGSMPDAIVITSSGVNAGVTDALDVSAANIDNALNIGANDIEGTDGTITFTDFTLAAEGRITMSPDNAGDAITITTAAGASEALSIDATADSTDADGLLDIDMDVNNAPGGDVEGINLDFELVTGGAGNVAETHSAILVTVNQNSADEVNDDALYGINIANLGGTARDGVEAAVAIGSGWDRNLLFADTTTSIGISDGGTFTFENATGTDFFTAAAGTFTVTGALNPEAAGTRDLGLTTAEWDQLYLADDGGLAFGLDQDAELGYDETTDDRVELTGINASLWLEDRLSLGRQTFTMSTGGAATENLTPTASYVEITGHDNGADIAQIQTTSAKEGDLLIVTNIDATTVNLDQTATTKLVGGADVAITQFDVMILIFDGTNWLQAAAVTANS